MSHSHNDFITKSKLESDSQSSNNILHDSIISCDTEQALKIIKEDSDGKWINIESLGNTPLMLALKTGNIPVAEALVSHSKINLNDSCSRGLTPLHYACMLRQDKLIQSIMSKAPRLIETQVAIWWNELPDALFLRKFSIMTPFDLYCNNMSDNYGYLNGVEFKDHKHLRLVTLPTYTDMLMFFMRSVWFNLNIQPAPGMPYPDFKFLCDIHSTMPMFKHNFNQGYRGFICYRNSLPVNVELARTLQRSHDNASRVTQLLDQQMRLQKSAQQLSSLALMPAVKAAPLQHVKQNVEPEANNLSSPEALTPNRAGIECKS